MIIVTNIMLVVSGFILGVFTVIKIQKCADEKLRRYRHGKHIDRS